MSQFQANLSSDAIGTFLTDFAEPINFVIWKGATLTGIKAIVDRSPGALIQGLPGAAAYKFEIWVANDPNGAAGPATINKGKDYVTLAKEFGDTAVEKFTVMKVLGVEDAGMWHLVIG